MLDCDEKREDEIKLMHVTSNARRTGILAAHLSSISNKLGCPHPCIFLVGQYF